MIIVKNVTKSYGKKSAKINALQNINLEIPSSSTVAIVGKSGSGKSTLMHIISGLDHPSTGKIIIDGVDLHKMSQKKMDSFRSKKMGFIFQSFFVEPNQSCYQNIALPLEIARVSTKLQKKLITKSLEDVDLLDKIGAKANDLSGGQKQRLSIARAIVNKPKIIFADEPTGNLDSVNGEKIIDLLFNLNKTLKSTLILVTHDPDLANRCQMRIYLKDGEIESIENNSRIKKGEII